MIAQLPSTGKNALGCPARPISTVSHEGKTWEDHSLPFPWELQAVTLPQNKAMPHNPRTDKQLGPTEVREDRGLQGGQHQRPQAH